MINSKYSLPVTVVRMPLNEDGEGPEMEEAKIARIIWEVWDTNNTVVCTCFDEEDAKEIVGMMNKLC